jgi:DNA-3-methyladenine glycosylase I
MKEGLIKGKDGEVRCWWPTTDEGYLRGHDEEWGHHVTDDVSLFGKVCLEGFRRFD